MIRLLCLLALLVACGGPTPAPATARSATLAALEVPGADRAVIVIHREHDAALRSSDAALAETRVWPMSTFKVPNTIVALETGIAPDESFTLPWNGEPNDRAELNHDHTLTTALRDSVVWYYQEIARRTGHERMAELVHGMRYGNEDIGDASRIDHFWLDGPLAISPREQVEFLERLVHGELPVSPRSIEILRRILPAETHGAATLRAKTGTCADEECGVVSWWVGWVEQGEERTFFATLLTSSDRTHAAALMEARKTVTREVLRREGILPDADAPQ